MLMLAYFALSHATDIFLSVGFCCQYTNYRAISHFKHFFFNSVKMLISLWAAWTGLLDQLAGSVWDLHLLWSTNVSQELVGTVLYLSFRYYYHTLVLILIL